MSPYGWWSPLRVQPHEGLPEDELCWKMPATVLGSWDVWARWGKGQVRPHILGHCNSLDVFLRAPEGHWRVFCLSHLTHVSVERYHNKFPDTFFWVYTRAYNFILSISQFLAATAAKSLQSCLTLCDPIDGSPPGSLVPGILQARILERVAISFSNAWKWKVKVKSLSRVWLLVTLWNAAHQAPPSMGLSRQEYRSGVPLPSPLNSWTHRLKRISTLILPFLRVKSLYNNQIL